MSVWVNFNLLLVSCLWLRKVSDTANVKGSNHSIENWYHNCPGRRPVFIQALHYTAPVLGCMSSGKVTLKLTPCQVKMNTVPLSFIRNHKYHSKDTRRAHPNPVPSFLKMIFKKVRFTLKISNITEIWKETKCKLIENTTISCSTPLYDPYKVF